MRYLVAGGDGFIGSHIVDTLLRQGGFVRVLDNFSTGKRENLEALRQRSNGNQFEVLEGDLRNPSRAEAIGFRAQVSLVDGQKEVIDWMR